MEISQNKFAFIGGGNMAQALIGGLIACGVPTQNINVSDPIEAVRHLLQQKKVNVFSDNTLAIEDADVVFFAIKPQVGQQVLKPLHNLFTNKLIISVMAGISVDTIKALTGSKKIIRIMPNTPALVLKGAYGVYISEEVNSHEKKLIDEMLLTTGKIYYLEEESHIDVVTAISGSGPAYFFYLMENIIQAGAQLGLNEELIADLTIQTAIGAAEMASQNQKPSELRKQVTSPNGTTEAALKVFDNQNIGQHIQSAVFAAKERSEELASELKI